MKNLLIFFFALLTISCGAITRDNIMQQKITIKDATTKKAISNVTVMLDNQQLGQTDTKGLLIHNIANPDQSESMTLTISHPNYNPITVPITAKPGGSYVGGGVALFLLGLVPGVVSLAVDGATGTWYSYEKRITLYMNPK